jgi:hypothetical protein
MRISDEKSVQELVTDVQNTYLFLKMYSSKKFSYMNQVSCETNTVYFGPVSYGNEIQDDLTSFSYWLSWVILFLFNFCLYG